MVRQCIAGNTRTYGALELKQVYRHNLMVALVLAGVLHALFIGGAVWFGESTQVELPPPVILTPYLSDFHLLPRPVEPVDSRGTGGVISKPNTGIPVPVPGDLIEDEPVLATRKELLDYVRAGVGKGGSGGIDSGDLVSPVPVDVVIPPMNTFIALEKDPMIVAQPMPEYPATALESGLTADLTVRVFIGADGKVLKAVIVRCSAPDVGFEEAALAAVASWEFRPAIQNGQPVGVWFNVPIAFRLN